MAVADDTLRRFLAAGWRPVGLAAAAIGSSSAAADASACMVTDSTHRTLRTWIKPAPGVDSRAYKWLQAGPCNSLHPFKLSPLVRPRQLEMFQERWQEAIVNPTRIHRPIMQPNDPGH